MAKQEQHSLGEANRSLANMQPWTSGTRALGVSKAQPWVIMVNSGIVVVYN